MQSLRFYEDILNFPGVLAGGDDTVVSVGGQDVFKEDEECVEFNDGGAGIAKDGAGDDVGTSTSKY